MVAAVAAANAAVKNLTSLGPNLSIPTMMYIYMKNTNITITIVVIDIATICTSCARQT